MLHPPTSPRTSTSVPVTEKARHAGRRSRRQTAAPLLCPYHNCPGSFRGPGYLKNHLRTHTREKPFGCPHEGCNSSFTQSSSLSHHLRTSHTPQSPFVCPQENCGYWIAKAVNLASHLLTHSGRTSFTCPHEGCRHAFTKSSGRTYHLRAVHSGEKPFVCPHEGCHHAFAQPSHRNDHIRIHSGEKPFVCPWEDCRHAFRQSSGLTYHRRTTHTGAKPFACPYKGCRYASVQSYGLTRHLRALHAGEQPFVCPQTGCGYAFTQAGALTSHLRVHAQERPFVCPHEHCSKRFTQFTQRTRHLKTHSREKRFRGKKTLTSLTQVSDAQSACPDARSHSGATGSHTDTLRTHLQVHGIRRPHVCHYPECDRRFLQLLALKMHQRRHTASVGAGSCQDLEQIVMQKHSCQPRRPARDRRHGHWSATGKRLCVLKSVREQHRHRHTDKRSCDYPDHKPANSVTGHQILKPHQRAPVRTHVPEALPIQGGVTAQPKAIYCRVIARVSGGIVYNTHQYNKFPLGHPCDTKGNASGSLL